MLTRAKVETAKKEMIFRQLGKHYSVAIFDRKNVAHADSDEKETKYRLTVKTRLATFILNVLQEKQFLKKNMISAQLENF